MTSDLSPAESGSGHARKELVCTTCCRTSPEIKSVYSCHEQPNWEPIVILFKYESKGHKFSPERPSYYCFLFFSDRKRATEVQKRSNSGSFVDCWLQKLTEIVRHCQVLGGCSKALPPCNMLFWWSTLAALKHEGSAWWDHIFWTRWDDPSFVLFLNLFLVLNQVCKLWKPISARKTKMKTLIYKMLSFSKKFWDKV